MRWLCFALVAALAAWLAACSSSHASTPGIPFEKRTLDGAYRAEGVAVVDVNRDGVLDIATDQYWYAGPSFVAHEIRAPVAYDPATQQSDGMAVYPWDVDGDGWIDLVIAPHPTSVMLWYANPQGRDEHWAAHVIAPDGAAGIETPLVVDLFGDGTRVLVTSDSNQGVVGWSAPPADPTQPWPLHAISPPRFPGAGEYVHGVGVGDVDGDGRLDVLTSFGWFQQTADRATWTPHSFVFAADACSTMHVVDVNGDGRGDVLCANPHGYGFAWFEQHGAESFTMHAIDDSISQMHALAVGDLDGDGVPEFVSGKRFWARGPSTDPGVSDPPLLTYYSWKRGAAPTFERHDIDADSGIGTQVAVVDVDGDGKTDIVVSNKKGLFFFRQR